MNMENLINKIHLGDCLDIMKQMPDKCVDLVLTDPPYGIDYGSQLKGKGDGNGGSGKNGWKSYNCPDWDKERPSKQIFDELIRISKNQIIWGGNYFADLLPSSQGWLFWDKGQRGFSLADGELAWTSFDNAMRVIDYPRANANQEHKIHPTQKPEYVFNECIKYAKRHGKLKEDAIILDVFSGSGTLASVCYKLGLKFICIEKDPEYHRLSIERLEKEQNNLFNNL